MSFGQPKLTTAESMRAIWSEQVTWTIVWSHPITSGCHLSTNGLLSRWTKSPVSIQSTHSRRSQPLWCLVITTDPQKWTTLSKSPFRQTTIFLPRCKTMVASSAYLTRSFSSRHWWTNTEQAQSVFLAPLSRKNTQHIHNMKTSRIPFHTSRSLINSLTKVFLMLVRSLIAKASLSLECPLSLYTRKKIAIASFKSRTSRYTENWDKRWPRVYKDREKLWSNRSNSMLQLTSKHQWCARQPNVSTLPGIWPKERTVSKRLPRGMQRNTLSISMRLIRCHIRQLRIHLLLKNIQWRIFLSVLNGLRNAVTVRT